MTQPNFILINCDDLGYGDVGCYGSTVNRTPHLDALAAGGMRFTDFYMASPVCSPSRGAMLTGCYPNRIGFDNFEGLPVLFPGHAVGLNPSERTIASILKDQGYATKLVGKWHCGDQPEFLPTRHGFDSYYGLPYSNDMGRQARKGNRDWIDRIAGAVGVRYDDHGHDVPKDYPPLPLMADEEVIQQQPDQAALTERYVEQCLHFLRDNRDGPFFLYFAHMYVHLPIYPPQPYLNRSQNGRYGAAVEHMDWSVGVLMHELRRLGLADNTIVVFTSDNGSRARGEGGSNAPLRGTKGTTWEGGQRLPCIVHWPAQVPAGATCSQVATSMDFLPTFAALAGGAAPDDRTIDGRDITPLLRGEPDAASPHEAFYYFHVGALEAVRRGRWKLHVRKGKEQINELYDLSSDVGETENVYDRHPDVVRELSEMIDAKRLELGDRALGMTGTDVRPVGRVGDQRTLTTYDPQHPYVMAEYDLADGG